MANILPMFGPRKPTDDAPLSLKRITNAFAAMLGQGSQATAKHQVKHPTAEAAPTPSAIVEALLFVGTPKGEAISREQLAATMRDVSPEEVDRLVAELTATYEAEGSALVIQSSAGRYRLGLQSDYQSLRQKYLGRLKGTTLSPTALEVLAVVAYRQPIELSDIDRLREAKSHPLLSQLVRRGLVAREKLSGTPARTVFHTTTRFLTLFGIDSIDQLPRAEEFDLPDLPPDAERDKTTNGAEADPGLAA